jgi:hypothetical protein
MIHKDFGLNPKDERPQLACEDCGLIDATVRRNYDSSGFTLCDDCADRLAESVEG